MNHAHRPYLAFLVSLATLGAAPAQAAIKVACVGEHTTHSRHNTYPNEYPAKLQAILGATHEVGNFGYPSAIVLRKPHDNFYKTYTMSEEFPKSLAFTPDIVVIGPFGKHDARPEKWTFKAEFPADLKFLVEKYTSLPNKPRVFLALPIPYPFGAPGGVTDEVSTLTKQVAAAAGLPTIDLYRAFLDQKRLFTVDTHLTPCLLYTSDAADE